MTIGIADVQDLVVEANLVEVQDVIDQLGHLLLCSHLPVTGSEVSFQPWESQDGKAVLLRLVDHPVPELCVGRHLDVMGTRQPVMPSLKEDESIVVLPDSFLNMHQLRVRILSRQRQGCLGLIEDMKDIVEA